MQNTSLRSGKSFQGVRVSDVSATHVMDTARMFIDDAGEGQTVKARLRSAASSLGIDFGLAKRIRYREIKNIPAHIFTTMADRYALVLERRERTLTAQLETYRKRLTAWKTSQGD